MSAPRTFTDVFRATAGARPERTALVLLTEREGRLVPEEIGYGALDRHARILADRLRRHTVPGDRVLILQSSRRLFTASFLACLYAGAVAVPVAPPGGRGHHDERIAGIVKDAAAGCVLTEARHAAEVSQLLARTGFGDVVCAPADLPHPAGDGRPATPDAEPHRASPEDVAYLQYTSGSTREPRGVMITHRNLLANQEAIRLALGTGPESRIGGWLPFHHDMGLVGQLLHPLWLGTTAVLLTPATFVKKPAHWLETVSRYRLTVSGGSDFAYDLCVRRVNDLQLAGLDLSGWRTAVNGGEPVRAETLRAFAERFAAAGLRPEALTCCYGLAEATLLVSGAAAPEPARPRTADAAALEEHRLRDAAAGAPHRPVVACGPAAADTDIRIVDPDTGTELPDGRIGEIWVRGDGVAPGYWRRPAETAETFDARLGGQGGYLRTGDLGAMADGLLHLTGRIKDMIVVAGRNLYPQDLERTVQQIDPLFGGATVFAVPDGGEGRERVVVVQELRDRGHYDIDLDALARAVETRIGEEYEIRAGGILLVRSGTVRRTSSGKVERAAMRLMFLRGEITPLHARLDPGVETLLTSGARA
ncbi:fatty acyl-AMP ligase [Streptomyces ferrugineus]|uniref:Fatty acyl-AMP ligase n=1 Tax=Streptomyces ferrugineus TaxID=1413221 RepID=A0A7M2SJQ4_9ACTN|nr:fatty acyl-AMP ligase [Streptomyces ferrugineus]QOV35708.1 fatty acyl-AMP ligase [Streptomyces ferrugineus]